MASPRTRPLQPQGAARTHCVRLTCLVCCTQGWVPMGQRAVCQILRGGAGATTRATDHSSAKGAWSARRRRPASAATTLASRHAFMRAAFGRRVTRRYPRDESVSGRPHTPFPSAGSLHSQGQPPTLQVPPASPERPLLPRRARPVRRDAGASRAFGERGRSRSGPGLWRRIALWPAGRNSRLRRRS